MVLEFVEFLNKKQRSIRFTHEMESGNKLAFLDCLVIRGANGSLSTSVYRKRTHTDQYLNFESHNPTSTKASIVGCLARRAQTISGSPHAVSRENRYLVDVFTANSYPVRFVKNSIKKV